MNDITLLSTAPVAGALSTAQLAGTTGTPTTAKPINKGNSPHCKVCGDESSGFHYGVDSCEGCKGFFRRCITQGMTHKCANEEKCEITPFTRNSCQYCRLKKCFEVGMSREASRLGRRPKRLKDVSGEHGKSHGNLPIAPYPSPAEMYRLRMAELQKLLQANGTFKAELMEAFLSAAQASFRDHAKQPATSENINVQSPPLPLLPPQQQQQPNMPIVPKVESGYSSLSSPASSTSQSPSQDVNLLSKNSMQFIDNMNLFSVPSVDENSMAMTSELSPLTDNLSLDSCFNELLMEQITIKSEPTFSHCEQDSTESVDEFMEALIEAQKTPSDTRRHLLEQVTDSVIAAHMGTTINSHQAVDEANNRINKDLLTKPDFRNQCCDPATVWNTFLKQMVPEITNVVKFCKKLPGFLEIEQEDQINLIKQGSFEVLLARFSMLVNPEINEMIDPTHCFRTPRNVVVCMPMGVVFEEFFHVSEQFNPLNLTDGEIGLFTSVLIICPDRQNIKNKRAVKKIQELFQQALYLLMKRNHSDTDQLFVKLLSTIPMFRRINAQHSMALNNIKMRAPEIFNNEFPPLHKEIFDQ